MDTLVEGVLSGNRRALARLLTWVENERGGVDESLALLFPHTGRAHTIGITGAPGTGKSSLVNALTKVLRDRDKTVAVLAVDPTSPFSGGAILGDRIRMHDLWADSGVFIRSMATRGSLGGLARATRDAVRVMDAAGFDYVLVETVGAGQNEVDIVRVAQTIIVVEAPGLGDDVQAIKAGILEIADILVVNKADRPEARQTVRALRGMLEIGHPASRTQLGVHAGLATARPDTEMLDTAMWIPPIIETVAVKDEGISALVEALDGHHQHLLDTNSMAQIEQQQIEIELRERLQETMLRRWLKGVSKAAFTGIIEQIQSRELDPQSAVYRLLDQNE